MKKTVAQVVSPNTYRDRTTYRQSLHCQDLHQFQVVCQETDLLIRADRRLDRHAHEEVVSARARIERFIDQYPDFATTLKPWRDETIAPEIIRTMIHCGRAAGVGPMAAVAGAVAESVGRGLLNRCKQVIVENGGDIFMCTEQSVVAGLFAGGSPLSMKVGVQVPGSPAGIGLCTSSATVGHSLSTGMADAVCVISPSCPLADAAATAIGNRIKAPEDIQTAIAFGRKIAGVAGMVVVVGEKMGAWGQVKLVSLKEKKVEF